MDIRQMEALIAVIEAGSFSGAGHQLHLTQPTVSAHIGALEQETGIRLIDRSSGSARPTDAGQILYAYAKQIVDLRDEALETVSRLSRVMEGSVTVAASSIPGHYYLPGLMQSFREEFPGIRFEVQITDSADVVRKVSGRRADLGFTGTVIENRNCIYREFASDRLVLITPVEPRFLRLREAGVLPSDLLLREPFINREPGSGTRKETERFFRTLGVEPDALRTVVEVPSTEGILNMVSEGMGVAVVSQSACRDLCALQKLLAFDFGAGLGTRSLYLVCHRKSILSPIAQAFYDHVRNRNRENA